MCTTVLYVCDDYLWCVRVGVRTSVRTFVYPLHVHVRVHALKCRYVGSHVARTCRSTSALQHVRGSYPIERARRGAAALTCTCCNDPRCARVGNERTRAGTESISAMRECRAVCALITCPRTHVADVCGGIPSAGVRYTPTMCTPHISV